MTGSLVTGSLVTWNFGDSEFCVRMIGDREFGDKMIGDREFGDLEFSDTELGDMVSSMPPGSSRTVGFMCLSESPGDTVVH